MRTDTEIALCTHSNLASAIVEMLKASNGDGTAISGKARVLGDGSVTATPATMYQMHVPCLSC